MPPPSFNVLIVDDDLALLHLVKLKVSRLGYGVQTASHGHLALELFTKQPADLAIFDLNMPEMTGLELMDEIHAIAPNLPVIILTSDTHVPRVVDAMRRGAYDFLPKPLDDNLLEITLRQATERVRLQMQVASLSSQLGEFEGKPIIAESPSMRRVLRLVRQGAQSNASVLLLGESGTGKGMLAREIHRSGPRKAGPFIAVDCAAIPSHLLESELFGHEKGAFTGAMSARVGKFEAANGGVIFLDELGEMPVELQAKLLRVLQEREVVRIGSNKPIPLDVRVLAATNVNLHEQMAHGAFREDLYYRLAVLEIHLPALRDRREDIVPLAHEFLKRANDEEGREITGFEPAALEILQAFDYQGNIRQLENIVTHAVIVAANSLITVDDLPPIVRRKVGSVVGSTASAIVRPPFATPIANSAVNPLIGDNPLMSSIATPEQIPRLRDWETMLIQHALALCGGNVSLTARKLKIGRATLHRHLNRLESESGSMDDLDTSSDSAEN